jgi:hypothetical protein
MAQDNSPLGWLRGHLQRRKLAEQQFRAGVRAQNVNSVNELAKLTDAELIATAPGIPSETHQMELSRRLKAAIQELTGETIAARESSDRASARIAWLNVILVILTAALVALTIVLAIRS